MPQEFHLSASRATERESWHWWNCFFNSIKEIQTLQTPVSDDFDRKAIRRKIYHLYHCQAKEHVTLAKLLVILQEDNIFHSQRSMLHILLREIGFKWVTITFVMTPINIALYRHERMDDRRNYYNQSHIIEQKHTYLHQMMNDHQ